MKELDRFRKFLTEDKKSISGGMLLSENAPGYDTRKFGKPLPTLESVQEAHEAKVKESEDYLGNFDFTIYGPEYDFATGEEMGTDPQEINYEATLDAGSKEEMIALAKEYAANSPKEKFIVTHSDDPWDEVWSTDVESMDKKERRAGIHEGHKHTYKQIDPDGTAECTKCGLRNSDPSKTGEKVRAGVRSAAEKLGMKPSHIKEDSFSGAEIDPNIDLYTAASSAELDDGSVMGYIELMDIDDHLEAIHYEWEKWRDGPETEIYDIDPARTEVLQYIGDYLKRSLK